MKGFDSGKFCRYTVKSKKHKSVADKEILGVEAIKIIGMAYLRMFLEK